MVVKNKKIEILQKDNPVLREVSLAIPEKDIKSTKIKETISNLKNAIKSQADAVAISAIQIGAPVRLFVISKKVFKIIEELKENTQLADKEIKMKDAGVTDSKDLIFINPKIVKFSKTKQELEEGCLSVRYFYGKVTRPEKVIIEAYDENGKKFSRGFSGFLAQVVQHEYDHLDGILFIDKATDVVELSPAEYEKNLADL